MHALKHLNGLGFGIMHHVLGLGLEGCTMCPTLATITYITTMIVVVIVINVVINDIIDFCLASIKVSS